VKIRIVSVFSLILFLGILLRAGIVCADDALDIDHAIADLNEIGEKPFSQLSIYAVVSFQTNVPVGKLMVDRAANRLSYGELLVAESLAVATAKSVEVLVEQRQKNQSWAQLSKENRINPGSLTARLLAAVRSMHTDESAERQRQPRQKFLDYKLDTKQAPAATERGFSPMTGREPMAPIAARPPLTLPRRP
jgi:hypothetical protein